MKLKTTTVGSFEAKTHLSRLLEEVKNGAEVTITKRGKPVARLIPYREKKKKKNKKEVISKFADIRGSVEGAVNVKEFINEGRKY